MAKHLQWIIAAVLAAGAFVGPACTSTPPQPGGPFAIAWSYDTSGYLEVCGCSTNMLGGMPRRATQLTQLRSRQPVLAIEGAHFIEGPGGFQLFKGETILRICGLLGYDAGIIGARETQHGADGLAVLEQTADFPLVCSNLELDGAAWPQQHAITSISGNTVGIIGLTQPQFVNFELPEGIGFTDPQAAFDKQVRELEGKCSLVIACLEGEETWLAGFAQRNAGRAGLFLTGNRNEITARHEFTSSPPRLNNYDYGRYLGLVTADPAQDGYSFSGLTLPLEETLADDELVEELLETDYKTQLKERFFAQMKYDLEQLYLPPDSCEPCHSEAYGVYTQSGHINALDTLFNDGQLYNPDCMPCHVIYDPSQDTLRAMNCIVCHSNITEQHIWDAVEGNVEAPTERITAYTFEWCAQCHDDINSPRFKEAWPQMVNRIYHGGDNSAALAAAEELGIDYSAPPPPK